MSERNHERPLAVITLGSALRFLADMLIAIAGITIGKGLEWWWVPLGIAAGVLRGVSPDDRQATR